MYHTKKIVSTTNDKDNESFASCKIQRYKILLNLHFKRILKLIIAKK